MEIKRTSSITHEEFIEEHLKPGVPVVFENASKVWKANGLFTPDWFRENFADRTTIVKDQEYTMREIMDMVEASSVENPAPYPCIFNVAEKLPEIEPLIQPLNLGYAQPNWFESSWFKRGYWGGTTELFIGGPGGQFPYMHIDYYHLSAWITQLYGQKRFIAFPRGQEDLLYIDPNEKWKSKVNVFNPDYDLHPKFKEATPISFVIGPGETLYMPFGMWHTAYSLTPTISIAFDQLNGKNYNDFMRDVWDFKKHEGFAKASLQYGYALVAGQMCKLGDTFGVKR
jgi:histone arginine demethylase JMJD6